MRHRQREREIDLWNNNALVEEYLQLLLVITITFATVWELIVRLVSNATTHGRETTTIAC